MHIFIGLSPCWTGFRPWSELFGGGDWRAAEVINEECWCWFDPCCAPQSPLWPFTRSSGLQWQSAQGAVLVQWRTGIAGGEMFLCVCVCVCVHVPTHWEIFWTLVPLSRSPELNLSISQGLEKFSSSKNKTAKTKIRLQSWVALPFHTQMEFDSAKRNFWVICRVHPMSECLVVPCFRSSRQLRQRIKRRNWSGRKIKDDSNPSLIY